jgi:nucleoid-associated protein EbfC
MFNKIKAVQDLRTQANQIKKALEQEIVEGSGAWGKVKIKIDGNQEVKSVEIADEIIGDKVKLETGVKEATNDAIKKVQRVMAQKMSEMGGLNIPGLGGK